MLDSGDEPEKLVNEVISSLEFDHRTSVRYAVALTDDGEEVYARKEDRHDVTIQGAVQLRENGVRYGICRGGGRSAVERALHTAPRLATTLLKLNACARRMSGSASRWPSKPDSSESRRNGSRTWNANWRCESRTRRPRRSRRPPTGWPAASGCGVGDGEVGGTGAASRGIQAIADRSFHPSG